MSEPTDNLVELRLVPVEVFGTGDCCEHGLHGEAADVQECQATGYGLSDAVSAWSDCNRAGGKIYRVDDTDAKYRQAGETVRIYVRAEDVAWFEKRWGDNVK